MAEDINDDDTTDTTAVATPDGEDAPVKLQQVVEIKDAGPCRKHVKVTVDRGMIDERFDEKFTELVFSEQPQVRGFRPGKAPRKMIEKQYYESVAEEIKTQVLMASLEQLAEEEKISPLSPPELDPNAIAIPKDGPFVYEFEIEVRPEFDLPTYKGLKLRRPTHTFSDAEVAKEQKRILEPYGQIIPKEPAVVALGDTITTDVVIMFGDKELNKIADARVKVEKQLALADGVAEDFGAKLAGAKPGDERAVDIKLSQELPAEALRGRKVQAKFTVKDVKTTRPPEITEDLLEGFGVKTEGALGELVKSLLERRLEYTQRQVARQSVLEQIAASATWELPKDMLIKQARKTLHRRLMEMKNSGMSDQQIAGRRRILEQDVLANTSAALKEHFVLQKVAEMEKLEIEDQDLDDEIDRMASQSDESSRKVRARLEKEELMEALATDLLERKALDLILANAVYEDYEANPNEDAGEVSTVEGAASGEAGATPDAPPAAEDAAK